jgi:hypothetical protein
MQYRGSQLGWGRIWKGTKNQREKGKKVGASRAAANAAQRPGTGDDEEGSGGGVCSGGLVLGIRCRPRARATNASYLHSFL